MCCPSALVGGARAVAGEHVPAAPTGEAHEVALVAACVQPRVSEGVPEDVRVKVGDTGLDSPPLDHLGDGGVGHGAESGQEERRQICEAMALADT